MQAQIDELNEEYADMELQLAEQQEALAEIMGAK